MKNIWNLTKKDLKIILKDRAAITWLFILPVVFITDLFCPDQPGSWAALQASQETDTRTRLTWSTRSARRADRALPRRP